MKYIESWLIYILLIFLFPKKLNRVSDFLMVCMLCLVIAPLMVFYGLSNASREHIYIILLGVVLIAIFRKGHMFRLPIVRGGSGLAISSSWLGVLAVTVWMVQSGGLNFFNLDLTRVYEFRSDVGEVINQGIMTYLNIWTTKVFGPLLLAIALSKKNYVVVAIICCCHILWFGISSHKAVLFYPLVILLIWFCFGASKAITIVPIGISLVISIALTVYFFIDSSLLGSLLIRRVFFIPAFLTFTYYDFFSNNPFVYWSYSITSSIVNYPYEMSPPKLIGAYLNTESHANNSFISTGYMHAGILGVMLYGVVVGLLFRFIDSVAYRGKIPLWFSIAIIIIPSWALITSADLPTSLLTHGLGMSILFLYMYSSKRKMHKIS